MIIILFFTLLKMRSIFSIFKNIYKVWAVSPAAIAAINDVVFVDLFTLPEPEIVIENQNVDEPSVCPICSNSIHLSKAEILLLKSGQEFMLDQNTFRESHLHPHLHLPQFFDCVAHPTHATTVMCDTLTPPNVDLIVKST
jgi:hypothetical protein